MLVTVIADEALKEELLAQKPQAEGVQLHFIHHPGEQLQDVPVKACIDLLFDGSTERTAQLKKIQAELIVINAVMVNPDRSARHFVRINGWPGFLKREIIEASFADTMVKDDAASLFALLGKKTEWVPDIQGMISARVVAAIINEAFFALEENISTETEIDTAMKLGTNYPFGPFEWSQKIGLKNIYTLLRELAKEAPRYMPCKLLEKRAFE